MTTVENSKFFLQFRINCKSHYDLVKFVEIFSKTFARFYMKFPHILHEIYLEFHRVIL